MILIKGFYNKFYFYVYYSKYFVVPFSYWDRQNRRILWKKILHITNEKCTYTQLPSKLQPPTTLDTQPEKYNQNH